jgi:5-methylcytosine-specific restriction endonuclease McrA
MTTMPSKPRTHLQTIRPDAERQRRRDYDVRRRQDPALARAAQFRSSQAWHDLRDRVLRRYPLCCDPYGVHGEPEAPAKEVHHIEALVRRYDLRRTTTNLAPLCSRCHARVSRVERSGGDAAGLFAAWRERMADERE